MDVLIELLEESSNLYKNFLELEYKKYDTVIKNDVETLDDIVSKEQAYYLKIRGIDQKREKLLDSMGYKNMTLKEVIEAADDKKTVILKEKYEEFAKIIAEVKKISDLCKTIIKVRMHRIDRAIKQLGENENTYTVQESKNKTKSLLLSKKI